MSAHSAILVLIILSIATCYLIQVGKISTNRFPLGRFLSTHMPTIAKSIPRSTSRINIGYTSMEHGIEKSLSDDRI